MSELFYNRVIRLNTLNDSVYSVNIMLFYRIYLHFTYEAIQTTGVYIYRLCQRCSHIKIGNEIFFQKRSKQQEYIYRERNTLEMFSNMNHCLARGSFPGKRVFFGGLFRENGAWNLLGLVS